MIEERVTLRIHLMYSMLTFDTLSLILLLLHKTDFTCTYNTQLQYTVILYSHTHSHTYLDHSELDELGGEADELVRVHVGLLCPLIA